MDQNSNCPHAFSPTSLKSNAVNPNNVVYAAFLAVRLNSQTGNLIDEPVLVQDEVKKILQLGTKSGSVSAAGQMM